MMEIDLDLNSWFGNNLQNEHKDAASDSECVGKKFWWSFEFTQLKFEMPTKHLTTGYIREHQDILFDDVVNDNPYGDFHQKHTDLSPYLN